jgi:hypothetical protein
LTFKKNHYKIMEIYENRSIEDIPGEEWRDVVGYEGKYQVSSFARVKSLNYHRSGKEKILKLFEVRGYLYVGFCNNGNQKHPLVHRLVACAFIPNPDNLPFINHKDENTKNNFVENIEWCDPKYNVNYGTRNERVSVSLLNRKDLSKPVLCVETGVVYPSAAEADRCTGANFRHISNCCLGKRQTTGGYHWRYV